MSSNPTRDKLPFEPLFAPRVSPATPTPPTPINWFEVLAPRLTEAPKPPSTLSTAGEEAGTTGPRLAAFLDVEEIASRARSAMLQTVPDPPEIVALREGARVEAALLLAKAQEEAVRIEREAREAGYRGGYAPGYAQGEQDATRNVEQRADTERAAWRENLTQFIAHIESERQRAWLEMEPQIIGMVFDLAKQVIKQEIEVSREVALSVVQNALRRVTDSTTLRVRVHADDLETIRANREDLLTLVDGMRHIEIVEDRRVGAGGCVVETGAGNIDARIETQLDTVADALEQITASRRSQ